MLWRSEPRNVLATAIRRKALTIEAAKEIARKAEASFERCAFAVSSDTVLYFVATSGCTAYNCEFVALTDVHPVPLITVDRQILEAFPKVAVSLEKFVQR